jgi:lipid II:glycine glycyltransferase (peptidoglycan interpeptide bridge formation enzyme)
MRGATERLRSAIPTSQFITHCVLLEATQETQLRKLRDSTRRNIQRAGREGVEVQHLQSVDAVNAFYSLHCRTRRRHGLPPQPLRFFHLIHKHLIEPGFGFISLARFKERWIAGSVFLRFGSQAIYKFGASDPRFQHVRANNLVMWQGISRLQKDNVCRLSLGRSDLNDEGLLRFKRGWGGEEMALSYCRIGFREGGVKSHLQSSNAEKGFSHRVMRRVPLPVLRLMGRLIYRHIG